MCVRAWLPVSLNFALIVAACGDEAPPPADGTVTLGVDDGVDFHTGRVMSPGTFANTDLFASGNGDSGLRLSSGGDSPTSGRPVIWFRTAGLTLETYASLDEVPSAIPETADVLLHAKVGLGFVLETADGDLVRGWLSAADPASVTIEWAREAP